MLLFGHNTWAKFGSAVLRLFGEALSPSDTMSHGPRSTSVQSGILIYSTVWPRQTWSENEGSAPFAVGELRRHQHNVAGSEAYLHAKFRLDPSNRLATIHQRHRQTDNDLIA